MTSNTDLVVTAEARSTIEEIYHYTLERWGEQQAETYEAILNAAFHRIWAFPDLGRVVTDDDPALRKYQLEHHTIVYRHDPGTVTILRIVNPRRLRR